MSESGPPPRTAGPLSSPAFRRLFSSTVLSSTGDWLDFVAVLILVSSVWDAGATGLALIAVAVGAPLLLAPVIGVWADRLVARDVMVAADVARALVTLGAAVSPSLLVLAPLLFLRSGIGVAFSAAEQRALVAAVPAADLHRANALQQSAVQALKIAAPVLGSLLTVAVGPRLSIGLNSASFLLSGLLLIGLPRVIDAATPEGGFVDQLREGASVVLGSAALRLLLVSLSATLFMTFTFDSMLPLAVTRLELSDRWIGFLVGAVGLGALLGSLALSQVRSMRRPLLWVGLGQAGIALTMTALAAGLIWPFDGGKVLWLVVIFLTGVCTAGVLVPIPLVVQTSSPPQVLGRVWTFIGILPTSLQVVAPTLSAVLLQRISIGTLFLAAALGLGTVAVLTLLRQRHLPALAVDPGSTGRPVPPAPGESVPADSCSWSPATTTAAEEVNTMSNLQKLEQIGVELDGLSDQQQAVLTELDDQEIAVLSSIRSRLDAVSDDVEAHTEVIGGVIF